MAANTGVIEGQDLILYIEVEGVPTPIAHSTQHTLEPSVETRDRVSKDTGKWKNKVAGLLDWKAGCDALACYDGFSYATLFGLMISRQPVTLKLAGRDAVDSNDNWTPEQAGDTYFEGEAIISSLPKTAPNNADATFSVSFEGTGELTAKTVAV
ncbi:putative secreted protein [Mangrovibacterium marinum]|uniref:Putative secreted protein n=1 Tax=Mangrovibacterium marinum TaxID=1639118 RepID=A0A2T5C0E6_9BACT|nr:phage tail tube protein [Mangrovibacterium marinum]PTN08042.1 putative secreted protein [Mangrovibacterium marinum]